MNRSNHKIQIIFLNGPSSSGKTSIAKHLQEKLPTPYLHIGIDQLIEMMPEHINNRNGSSADLGFSWKTNVDEAGEPLAEIQLGPYAKKICATFIDIVITMAQNGHNIIIDEVCIRTSQYKLWKEKLAAYNVLYVGVLSSTDVLVQREKTRLDRVVGSARTQNTVVHQNKQYDLEVDSSRYSVDACVDTILYALSK